MAQRGVRFADGSLPGPPPPKQWVVPAFSSFKLPPPPPPPVLLAQAQAPKQPVEGTTLAKADVEEEPGTQVLTPCKKEGPPTVIQTGGNQEEGETLFASLSASALLSPISAMTEVTTHSHAVPRLNRVTRETIEPTHEELPTEASFETLATIDMLNFDYVRHCACAKDLGRIIRVLMDQNKSRNAPEQLLYAARQRLRAVQGHKAPPPPPPPRTTKLLPVMATITAPPTKKPIIKPVPPPPPRQHEVHPLTVIHEEKKDEPILPVMISPHHRMVPCTTTRNEQENQADPQSNKNRREENSPGRILTESTANLSRITLGNTTLESIDPSKGSLNLSYSPPSILRGLDLVDTPSRKGLDSSAFMLAETSCTRLDKISEMSTSAAVTPGSSYQAHLSAEVEKLSGDAAQMEQRLCREQVSFLEQLESLRRSKQEAASLIQILETKVEVISGEKDKALQTMHKVQMEQQQVRQALLEERARLHKRDNETRALEERLQRKIIELQKALTDEVERHRLTRNAEKNLRERTTSELTGQRERNVELNLLLRQTKENLERIKKTQDTFRAELLKAFGVNEDEFKNVPQCEFMQRMAARIREINTENMKLSEDLKLAKSAPNTIVQERDHLRSRIREVLRKNQRLEEDNANLGSRIEELSEEVMSSRVLIDKLLKTSHETHVSDWETKEAQYKAAIRNYQQKVREQASTVSLDLYRVAVDDHKRTLSQLHDASRKISDLEKKVTSLETADGPFGENTKTPNPKNRNGTSFFSPTDYLEKGLLFRDFHLKSPSIPLTLSAKKAKTPVSQVKHAVDLGTGRPTSSTKKSTKIRSYRSPIETMPFYRSEEPERTELHLNRAGEAQRHGELIGMTISFEMPIGALPSPQKDERTSTDEGGQIGMHNLSQGNDKQEMKRTAPSRYDVKKSIVSSLPGSEAYATSDTKENLPPILSPKSTPKTLRMQKAREVGGIKGLKIRMNKLRSPQPLGRSQRVALSERPGNP